MFKRILDKLLLVVVPFVGAGLIRFLYWSLRIDMVGAEHPQGFWDRGEQVILSFWHDQLLLMACGYHGPGAKILISASKDGELIARTMAYFGQDSVRGSSSRGGRAAFRHLLSLAREPFDLVITPDGPRGPRHEVKEGVVQLARLSGRPVVPMAFASSRGHRFRSWDRFLLPYPFGRGVYSFGEPLIYEGDESIEVFGQRLQAAMEENDKKARAYLESCGVSAV